MQNVSATRNPPAKPDPGKADETELKDLTVHTDAPDNELNALANRTNPFDDEEGAAVPGIGFTAGGENLGTEQDHRDSILDELTQDLITFKNALEARSSI